MDESDVFHGNKIHSDVSRSYGKAMNASYMLTDINNRHGEKKRIATLNITTLF